MPLSLPASTPLPFGPTAVGVPLIGGGFLLVGWGVEETTGGAAARLVIRDGQTSAGGYRVPITLAANESARDDLAGLGIIFESGLFVDVTAGSVAGCMFVIPVAVQRREAGMVLVGQRRPGEWVDLETFQ